jgi:hypothetical protein
MIHKAKDLSPDKKMLSKACWDDLLLKTKRSASARWRPRLPRNGCSNPGRVRSAWGWTGSLRKRSMEKSMLREKHGVIASSRWSNDPGCP